MMGLAILAGIAIYVSVCWLIVRALKTTWAKSAAVLAALAIPFWDLPIGYYNYYRHCAEEGGLRVSVQIAPMDAILVDPDTGYTPQELLRRGFKVIEVGRPGETIYRFTVEDGRLVKSTHSTPVSEFRIGFMGHKSLPWNLVQSETLITRVKSGEVLVRQNTFRWRGLWWQVQAAPLLGDGAICFPSRDDSALNAIAGKSSS